GNTVPASGTGGPASASIDNGGGPLCRFDPTATAFGAAGATPAGKMAPQGAFRFKLIGCNPGATVRVTTVWPLPVADFTKFSRGAFLPASHFTISGNTVSFDVTDGGLGDDDGQQNGEIVDPAMPLAARGGATAIPTLGEWGLLVLSALLGTLGWRRRSLSAR
ncbi:MAG: IPTL-CTERM sorting domain-containing protein, partial [Burkholderiaceae bacterium]